MNLYPIVNNLAYSSADTILHTMVVWVHFWNPVCCIKNDYFMIDILLKIKMKLLYILYNITGAFRQFLRLYIKIWLIKALSTSFIIFITQYDLYKISQFPSDTAIPRCCDMTLLYQTAMTWPSNIAMPVNNPDMQCCSGR